MATTADYLTQLQADKQNLVDILVANNIEASADETFTTLVPKTAEMAGGEDYVITDCSYLFFNGARTDLIDILLSKCTNVTNLEAMYSCVYAKVPNPKLPNCKIAPSSCSDVFEYCNWATEIDISMIDGTNTDKFNGMFDYCTELTKIIFPQNKQFTNFYSISAMFRRCSKLLEIDLSCFVSEKLTVTNSMCYRCDALVKADISPLYPAKITDSGQMFCDCASLTTLIINNSLVFPMTNVNMLRNTPIANGTGFVYVPDDLVETYKVATNWSTYATQIKPLSEYEGDYYGKE